MLGQKKIEIKHNFVGNYFTSLEMMGATLTVMRLDDELDRLLARPARSIGLVK